MGHNRLGHMPDTRPWRNVVGLIADGAAVAAVAGATSAAALAGLEDAKRDQGLARVVFLLARTALAARADDFAAALRRVGIDAPADPSLFDLTAAFADAMDRWYPVTRSARTDFGEMAELAAVEALTRCVGERAPGLFPAGGEVRRAVRACSTQKGFARLAGEFFARFAERFLLYHLGRELSLHVGGNGRFADPKDHTAFVDDLGVHCREAALIVKAFAGGWYSKAKFEAGITERQAAGFASYCVKKLGDELAVRGDRRG